MMTAQAWSSMDFKPKHPTEFKIVDHSSLRKMCKSLPVDDCSQNKLCADNNIVTEAAEEEEFNRQSNEKDVISLEVIVIKIQAMIRGYLCRRHRLILTSRGRNETICHARPGEPSGLSTSDLSDLRDIGGHHDRDIRRTPCRLSSELTMSDVFDSQTLDDDGVFRRPNHRFPSDLTMSDCFDSSVCTFADDMSSLDQKLSKSTISEKSSLDPYNFSDSDSRSDAMCLAARKARFGDTPIQLPCRTTSQEFSGYILSSSKVKPLEKVLEGDSSHENIKLVDSSSTIRPPQDTPLSIPKRKSSFRIPERNPSMSSVSLLGSEI